MLISFSAALTAVSTRGLINAADRSIFSKEKSDFLKSTGMNAIFPFLVALLFGYTQGIFQENMLNWIFHPGVFLSAFAAQLTSYGFAFSFKRMPVRNVVISLKLADLFLPFCILMISHKFSFKQYLFSLATVAAFTPMIWDVIKNKSQFFWGIAGLIISMTLFMSSLNEYLGLKPLVDTWPKFLMFMTALLFWRSTFVSMPLAIRWAALTYKTNPLKTEYHLLLLRSLLSYTSQVAFFYGIIKGASVLTWPILSTGPLVSCFFAWLLLREKMGRPEAMTLTLFSSVVTGYALIDSGFNPTWILLGIIGFISACYGLIYRFTAQTE